jgi:hypothetical protein
MTLAPYYINLSTYCHTFYKYTDFEVLYYTLTIFLTNKLLIHLNYGNY